MPFVEEIHDFHVWNLSDEKPIMTAHIVSDENPTFALFKINELLQKQYKIFHSTIQIEPRQNTPLKSASLTTGNILKCVNELSQLEIARVLK